MIVKLKIFFMRSPLLRSTKNQINVRSQLYIIPKTHISRQAKNPVNPILTKVFANQQPNFLKLKNDKFIRRLC